MAKRRQLLRDQSEPESQTDPQRLEAEASGPHAGSRQRSLNDWGSEQIAVPASDSQWLGASFCARSLGARGELAVIALTERVSSSAASAR